MGCGSARWQGAAQRDADEFPGDGASAGAGWRGAIFDRALDGDSDESGKRQLITALQAMAENPLFKNVLARVQERVDEAFNSTGGKKRGKNSPWVKWNEEIQRKQDHHDHCQQELKRPPGLKPKSRSC